MGRFVECVCVRALITAVRQLHLITRGFFSPARRLLLLLPLVAHFNFILLLIVGNSTLFGQILSQRETIGIAAGGC
jgi:hypothetical protein